MKNVFDTFKDRKSEVEFYYSVLEHIERHNNFNKDDIEEKDIKNKDIYSDMFIKISKSNLILILYNLVEASISLSILEIYEKIKIENHKYDNVIPEIRNIWSNKIMKNKHTKNTNTSKIVDKIVNDIIELDKESIGGEGNLDDHKIRKILEKHKINIKKTNGDKLQDIKRMRNDLAHGVYSFSECARDLSIKDLGDIKKQVLNFIESILNDIKKYYDEQGYLNK